MRLKIGGRGASDLCVTNQFASGKARVSDRPKPDNGVIRFVDDIDVAIGERKLEFEAISCDQVAVEAGAGKASIYARYANKGELFSAVVRDNVEHTLAPSGQVSVELPVRDRLQAVGTSIVTHVFQPDVVALMRVVISTAYRMPDLARPTDRIGREHGVQRVAAAIAGRDADKPEVVERALPLAGKFVDLVFVPHQMRALIGDDLDALQAQASESIGEAIDLL
ncbi:TetR/AcrR family transcriptional regulator [Sphingomonas koreensis]|nr:TetR/AcrR family transcriptional regulator [Sphingomonas koreensis]